jgi:hypothetical protein
MEIQGLGVYDPSSHSRFGFVLVLTKVIMARANKHLKKLF